MSQLSSLESVRHQLPPACKIIAVSKLQSVEKIRQLYKDGQREFAENYAQEAAGKQQELQDLRLNWHFIGRLQKNKIKQIAGKFSLIHSVDSAQLLEAIHSFCSKNHVTQRVLLQINLADESSKAGIPSAKLEELLKKSQDFSSVNIVGLMAMPPLVENAELNRDHFRELKSLLMANQKNYPDLKELSMGTSSDYLVAAQEGATMIRLGTILFGERQKL